MWYKVPKLHRQTERGEGGTKKSGNMKIETKEEKEVQREKRGLVKSVTSVIVTSWLHDRRLPL